MESFMKMRLQKCFSSALPVLFLVLSLCSAIRACCTNFKRLDSDSLAGCTTSSSVGIQTFSTSSTSHCASLCARFSWCVGFGLTQTQCSVAPINNICGLREMSIIYVSYQRLQQEGGTSTLFPPTSAPTTLQPTTRASVTTASYNLIPISITQYWATKWDGRVAFRSDHVITPPWKLVVLLDKPTDSLAPECCFAVTKMSDTEYHLRNTDTTINSGMEIDRRVTVVFNTGGDPPSGGFYMEGDTILPK